MTMIEYVFFDVSGTLLSKPKLFWNIQLALKNHGYEINYDEIKFKHKLLSEVIKFPDRTNMEFYRKFNRELLYLLGISPTNELLVDIFDSCTYLPWQAFEDTTVLKEIKIPMGIISNFNATLKEKIETFFGAIFNDIFVSEELGVAKPKLEFYELALRKCGIKPENTLYIGDSVKLDLEPALQVGMKALIVDRDLFYSKSHRTINSLYEINQHLAQS